MNRDAIDLRKLIIKDLKTDFVSFVANDISDNSEKEVFLAGSQRYFYKDYKIGDFIYAVKTIKNKWRLVTNTDFKRNNLLHTKKMELDNNSTHSIGGMDNPSEPT